MRWLVQYRWWTLLGGGSSEILTKTDAFARRAADHPKIGDAVHAGQLYQYILTTAIAGHDYGDPLKDDRVEEVRQKFDERRGVGEETAEHTSQAYIAQFVSADGEIGRLTLTGEMMTSGALRELLTELNERVDEVFGESAEVHPSGYLPLYASVLDYIVSSQIRNFGIAVVRIFGLMHVWMRSIRLAAISIVPNLLPVLAMFGTMSAAGISLKVTTASIVAIIIGVAIDDTIHFCTPGGRSRRRGPIGRPAWRRPSSWPTCSSCRWCWRRGRLRIDDGVRAACPLRSWRTLAASRKVRMGQMLGRFEG